MELILSQKERGDLEAVIRRQCGEARMYRRARMILLAAEGGSISAIARNLGTCRARVGHWIRQFAEHRLAGLTDSPRSGRPPEISPLERHQVIATACRSPMDLGYQRMLWSHETLATAVVSGGLVRDISPRTVGRILEDAEIKPHRVKLWCHSTDQALSRHRPLQPGGPGRAGRFDFEYKRNGTRCLFACFNVGTGKVLGHCTKQRKRVDFLSFMDRVASVYRQRRVHVVLDNLNTHRDTNQGAFMTEWNRRHGERFVFHYTPTHGSWLNQVELWFCILTRRILRYGNFHSPDELVRAILAFLREWNDTEAHAFRWTYEGLPLVQ